MSEKIRVILRGGPQDGYVCIVDPAVEKIELRFMNSQEYADTMQRQGDPSPGSDLEKAIAEKTSEKQGEYHRTNYVDGDLHQIFEYVESEGEP